MYYRKEVEIEDVINLYRVFRKGSNARLCFCWEKKESLRPTRIYGGEKGQRGGINNEDKLTSFNLSN